MKQVFLKLKKFLPSVKQGLLLLAALLCAVGLVYYWRVFYSYGQYPFAHIPAGSLTFILCGIVLCVGIAAFCIHHFIKGFAAKAAAVLFCVGLLFVFCTPPFQVPDEQQHFLRSYALASGHFDCDAKREYPEDVNALCAAFGGAWVNAHDGNAIKARFVGEISKATPETVSSAEAITSQYVDYARLIAKDEKTLLRYTQDGRDYVQTEPLPSPSAAHIPQAIGILLARIFGFDALGALYGGRIINLLFYALLCYFALKNCKRYRPVFLTVMFLPLSLFLAASCSYDAMLLGLYLFAASYYCKDEITARDIGILAIVVAVMTSAKINNILWLILPLVLPKKAWKTRVKKWQAALCVLFASGALYGFTTLYNVLFRYNYGTATIDRTIQGADTIGQLQFVLQNPVRTVMAFFGTLYENDFFLSGLGNLGNLDLMIPAIATLSVMLILVGAALSVHSKSSLSPRSAVGLFGFAALYAASVMGGLYITYTPVGMVRVIGLQTRYFLPCILLLAILVAALLSHVLEPSFKRGAAKAERLAVYLSCAVAVCGAILVFQHYFIGPVALLAA